MLLYFIPLTAQALPVPEGVNVSKGYLDNLGVWKMNIEWKDGFANSLTPETVTYDVKILYTEQMKVVHNVSGCFYNKTILFSFQLTAK